MRQDWLGSVYNVRKSELSSMLLQGYLPSRLKNKVRRDWERVTEGLKICILVTVLINCSAKISNNIWISHLRLSV